MARANNPNETNYTNGWSVNKKLVLHRLEGVEYDNKKLRERVESMEKQLAVYAAQGRIAAGFIGAIAGLVPTILAIVFGRL
jgi:hypothetical protein